MIETGTFNVMLAFMGLGSTELIILAVVMMVLFGGAKLPSLMRNMGRSVNEFKTCLLYTSPSPRDQRGSRMPSSA